MKKAFSLVLIFCFFLLTACSNKQTNIAEKVMLPIKGHFSVKGDIIVETDKISVLNDVIPNAQAFTYKDSEFYKLKRYETEITLPEEVTGYGKELNIPLQYFVCNKTVYAYPNVERKSLGLTIEICSVPNDENRILITAGTVLTERQGTVLCLVKPLEWLFLLVLYTFDTKPENRIHRQYLG